MKNYPELTKDISANLRALRGQIPDAMQGFSALAQAATKSQALDRKTKELIALAIGVATRCDGCIGFHSETLVKLGASREEVAEALGMAVYMGGGPALMYAADAIGAFDQFQQRQETPFRYLPDFSWPLSCRLVTQAVMAWRPDPGAR
jgi:AhpD family alkylhydroperoxidase